MDPVEFGVMEQCVHQVIPDLLDDQEESKLPQVC